MNDDSKSKASLDRSQADDFRWFSDIAQGWNSQSDSTSAHETESAHKRSLSGLPIKSLDNDHGLIVSSLLTPGKCTVRVALRRWEFFPHST